MYGRTRRRGNGFGPLLSRFLGTHRECGKVAHKKVVTEVTGEEEQPFQLRSLQDLGVELVRNSLERNNFRQVRDCEFVLAD